MVTIQFGVKAPAGTYCVALRNAATNRSYIAEYVIAAGEANTDTVKSVTVQLDTTGTWATDNTVGLYIGWALMIGPTYQSTAGSWQAGNFQATPNQFNFMGTGGNVFDLFDVSLTEGTTAPPFQVPDYASELLTCQRYFEKWSCVPSSGQYNIVCAGGWSQTNGFVGVYHMKVKKRSLPTVSYNGLSAFVGLYNGGLSPVAASAISGNSLTLDTITFTVTAASAPARVGDAGMLVQNGTGSAELYFNARL